MSQPSQPRRKLQIPNHLQRSHPSHRAKGHVDATALLLLEDVAEILGGEGLADVHMVDVGCGVKFTRAIVNHGLAVGRYTGLDVDPEVISFLTENVDDPRFEFHRIDVYNERYNPSGNPLDETTLFPSVQSPVDVLTGFSLFTHLDPGDFLQMARMMRAIAEDTTRLVFTAFLDQHSDGGEGFIDKFSHEFGDSMEGIAKGGYLDVDPDNRLNITLYDQAYARTLLERAGWEVEAIRDPTPRAQHLVIATPRISAE